MATLSLSSSPSLSLSRTTPPSHKPIPPTLCFSKTTLSFSSLTPLPFLSSQSFTFGSLQPPTSPFVSKFSETESSIVEAEPPTGPETSPVLEAIAQEPKREEVFAVVMIGSRQYIVFPGRYIYTQRLKGANVNDKVTLNKVLLVGTKTSTYIGQPVVPNASVHAVVEEQALDKKVIVFKYKKKKGYRRNIGHRQPITRIRIVSITGYENSPAATLPLER
ncbi:50S ribosomal protein L21, chloroplastic [Diospyros lotus]|uniref:50S ribosomal protein L21, chloroplastic n=1 Tax=Diospyros lotus TaxID=55363 RepID=UPI0022596426|nr:50S ribosomal protein L21, chloroplastic [Diospyros lotus]